MLFPYNMTFIRPHRLHAVHAAIYYRCRTYSGLCVCVLGTRLSCAKTAELIEMPFGCLTHVGPKKPCISWESRSIHGNGLIWGHEVTKRRCGL